MRLASVTAAWKRFSTSERGRAVLRVGRWLFMLGVVGYLVYELSRVGWEAIWKALPTQPLFYVLFLLLYFSLPLVEMLIYRVSWVYDAWRSFPAFIKKRVYNRDVMGYSGEVYFYTWARKNVGISELRVLETIRDNNILSSAASTLVALGLLLVFLSIGHIRVSDWLGAHSVYYAVGGAVLLAVLLPIAMRFRRYLFSMPARAALLIFGIQCARLMVGQVLQISQWAVVMPEVSLDVWFTFAAVSIILTRIPFIPNQSLIFLGVGVELSGIVDISTASVAGMLLVVSVLDRVMNAGLFGLITLMERKEGGPGAKNEDSSVLQPVAKKAGVPQETLATMDV